MCTWYMYLLTNYPILIPIPHKTADTFAQAYLQHIYTMFGGFLTLIIENRKEFKNELLQKVSSELGIKHQFFSPHQQQSNSTLEKFH